MTSRSMCPRPGEPSGTRVRKWSHNFAHGCQGGLKPRAVLRGASPLISVGSVRPSRRCQPSRCGDGNLHPSYRWLQVPITELFRLGVAHKISPYSHTDGTYAYLNEEDTVTFWWAREAMSQPCPCEIQLRATADPSPVRSLDRFAPPKIPVGMPVLVPVAEAADSSS